MNSEYVADFASEQAADIVGIHSHSAYVENAFQLQRQQTPLDAALRMVSRVWQRQPRLAIWLEDSITEVYRNPAGMVDALRSGRWQQACERHLMGG